MMIYLTIKMEVYYGMGLLSPNGDMSELFD